MEHASRYSLIRVLVRCYHGSVADVFVVAIFLFLASLGGVMVSFSQKYFQ